MTAEPNTVPAGPRPPDANAPPLFPVLNDYWEALRRGEETGPQHWLDTHAADQAELPDLHVLTALYDARQMLIDDSRVEGPDLEAEGVSARQLLQPGTRLGECRIEGLLGCGGMGEVYLAEHEVLGRKVAIKVLPARLAGDREAVQRFRRSLQILARLNPHPNIAAALHASEDQARLYLLMEYVPGVDLRAHVRQSGRLPVDRACELMRQTAIGLEYAHKHGIVHRDIKPSNLMLTPDGTVKILDLGLARLTVPDSLDASSTQTHAGAIVGTVDYMAPEQAKDAKRADGRSDLYSLGCTFYYLLTGRPPFADRSPLETLMAHALVAPEAIGQVRPEVPVRVAALVHKLLAKRPEERFPSVRAFLEALNAATGLAPTDKNEVAPAARQTGRTRFRRQRARALAALLVVGILAGAAFWLLTPSTALQDLKLTVRREGDDDKKELYTLVSNALTQSHKRTPNPLRPRAKDPDDFRLDGSFNRPTDWYLLWFDARGQVTVAERSRGKQIKVCCPEREDEMFSITLKDPPGVHLLLLIAGSLDPEEAEGRLTASLGGVGPPPQAMPEAWTFPVNVRGANDRTKTTPTWGSYFQEIEARLPRGLRTVSPIYLKTEKHVP